MGEVIADSTHVATILRNLPESWNTIAQTIRMITSDLDDIEERLEAHEADLNTIELSTQAATVFIAQSRGRYTAAQARVTTFTCNNCGREGHSASRCYAVGGGLAAQAPWMIGRDNAASRGRGGFRGGFSNQGMMHKPATQNQPRETRGSGTASDTAKFMSSDSIAMMASISEVADGSAEMRENAMSAKERMSAEERTSAEERMSVGTSAEEKMGVEESVEDTEEAEEMHGNILLSTRTSALMSMQNKPHIWLLDSAASSHLCGNHDLFESICPMLPILIETANGKSFTGNERGTVHISLQSGLSSMLPNLPITLLDIIYVPNLRANLLSVGRMTNENMEVTFRRDHSSLSMNNNVLTQGSKICKQPSHI